MNARSIMGETGFQPAALKFSAFIWLFVINGWNFWRLCSAQMVNLPGAFTPFSNDDISAMRTQFCNCTGISLSCDAGCSLCEQICKDSVGQSRKCWSDTGNTCEEDAYNTYCGYQDAVVCQYDDDDGDDEYCVFKYCSDLPPYCTGSRDTSSQSNPDWTQNSCAQATTPSAGNDQQSGSGAATVVLGCILALVLLLVILGAVWWYLRRRGKLPAFLKKTQKRKDGSSVELDARVSERASVPDPPALGSDEYSYAYGQRPGGPTTPDTGEAKLVDQADNEYQYYSKLEGEGSARYAKNGTGAASTEAPNDHQYFVLEKTDESETHISKDGGYRVDESSIGQADLSPEEDDHTYFPLLITQRHLSASENSGYEVAEIAPPDGEDDTSSPYDHLGREEGKKANEKNALSNNDDNDYHHLESNACDGEDELSSPYNHLDREASKKATGGALSNNDDNGYHHLESNAYDGEDELSSPYNHLDREASKKATGGALSNNDDNGYHHLEGNDRDFANSHVGLGVQTDDF